MWGPLRPKYSKKYRNPNIWRKKESLKARQGHIKHVCKISGSLTNGVDIGISRNLGFHA